MAHRRHASRGRRSRSTPAATASGSCKPSLGEDGEGAALDPRHEVGSLDDGVLASKFGSAWFDVDLNGCSTRNDILARDLRDVVFKAGDACFVAKGTLRDRYTDATINFVQGPGTSGAVQIDHVVALAAAWRTGAKPWTAARRLFYATTI